MFLEQMEDMSDEYTMARVTEFVFYSMPRMFHETIPYSALIGCLAGLGILANNSELLVMRAAGVAILRRWITNRLVIEFDIVSNWRCFIDDGHIVAIDYVTVSTTNF